MGRFAAGTSRGKKGGSETRPYGIAGARPKRWLFELIVIFATEIQAGFFTGDQARDIWAMFD